MTTAGPTPPTRDQFDSIVARIRDEMYPEDISDTDDAQNTPDTHRSPKTRDPDLRWQESEKYYRDIREGDEVAISIQRILGRLDLYIVKPSNVSDSSRCVIKTVCAVRNAYNRGNLFDTLLAIKHGFDGDLHPYESAVINGVSKALESGMSSSSVREVLERHRFKQFKIAVKNSDTNGKCDASAVFEFINTAEEENS